MMNHNLFGMNLEASQDPSSVEIIPLQSTQAEDFQPCP